MTAIFLSVLFMPIGFIVSVFYSMIDRDLKYFSNVIIEIAKAIDRLGNVVCGDLFDLCLVKKGDPFGDGKKTVSRIIQENITNLTLTGKALKWIIECIDKDHFKDPA